MAVPEDYDNGHWLSSTGSGLAAVFVRTAIGKADSLGEPLQGVFEGGWGRGLCRKADFLFYLPQIHLRFRFALAFGGPKGLAR